MICKLTLLRQEVLNANIQQGAFADLLPDIRKYAAAALQSGKTCEPKSLPSLSLSHSQGE